MKMSSAGAEVFRGYSRQKDQQNKNKQIKKYNTPRVRRKIMNMRQESGSES